MGVLRQLELAEQVEETAARIYRRLAEQYDADPATRALFQTLASEEDQHAARVKMLRNRFVRGDRATKEIPADIAGAEKAAARAEEAYQELLANPPATAWAARQFAQKLETEFADIHAEMLARDCHPDVHRLFTMLAKQDRMHAALAK